MHEKTEMLEPRRHFSGGLVVQYYSGAHFSTLAGTASASLIDANWTAAPSPAIVGNTYSVRWTGEVQAAAGGRYKFAVQTNAAAAVRVNSKIIVRRSRHKRTGISAGSIKLIAGKTYAIQVTLIEKAASASIALLWAPPRQTLAVVPASAFGAAQVGASGTPASGSQGAASGGSTSASGSSGTTGATSGSSGTTSGKSGATAPTTASNGGTTTTTSSSSGSTSRSGGNTSGNSGATSGSTASTSGGTTTTTSSGSTSGSGGSTSGSSGTASGSSGSTSGGSTTSTGSGSSSGTSGSSGTTSGSTGTTSGGSTTSSGGSGSGGSTGTGSTGSGSTGTGGTGSIPFAVPAMPSSWAGTLVITQGGTYSGNWQSLNPNTPAVVVRTSQPVTIDNANISSEGDLIDTDIAGANLTIENTRGWGLNPESTADMPGRFLDADGFVSITVKNNFLDNTSGIELSHYAGNNTSSQTITVDRNLALNIDGRNSNGNGGYSTTGSQDVQFVQLSHDSNLVGAEIAWNQIFNQPGQSLVEDNISIFESGGTSSSHLEIHDNFIDGGYPGDPTDSNYSGGGIMLGDGNASIEPDGYVDAYDNQVLNTTNYGIAIAADSNDSIFDNRVVSTGTLPDGTPLPAQNVGIYIWKDNPGPFSNNVSYGNVIGWQVVSSSGAITRNDEWLPDAESGTTGQDTSLPGPITQATEENEYSLWATKLQHNGVTIGPT